MGYLDQLISMNAYQQVLNGKLPKNFTAAALYPPYEIQTPQYITPPTYTVTQQGYRANTLIYAGINYRARAVAEAPIHVVQIGADGKEQELDKHELKRRLRKPNQFLTEEQFWQITEMSLLISGFCAWEYERSNGGDILNMWWMRPDWCSFYRGEGKPIRAVRYQPYGLPPMDVEIENVLMFQYFDPLFPFLKGLSPLAVALNVIQVDNFATQFLNTFFQKGAMPYGLLRTDQAINDVEAARIRDRWRQQHGGTENWSDIVVLGAGAEYQQLGAAFSPGFDFNSIDTRDEVRMCTAIGVDPILIGKGFQSKYSNYEEARKAFYEGYISPEWRYLASEVREQMLPEYDANANEDDSLTVEFDTSEVKALQEDRSLIWQRSQTAFSANLLTRDEARQEMGLDAVDNAPVFYADTLSFKDASSAGTDTGTGTDAPPDEGESKEEDVQETPQDETQEDEATQAAKKKEADQFKSFLRHGKEPSAFKFKFLSFDEQIELSTSIAIGNGLKHLEDEILAEAQGSDTPAPFRGETGDGATYP